MTKKNGFISRFLLVGQTNTISPPARGGYRTKHRNQKKKSNQNLGSKITWDRKTGSRGVCNQLCATLADYKPYTFYSLSTELKAENTVSSKKKKR